MLATMYHSGEAGHVKQLLPYRFKTYMVSLIPLVSLTLKDPKATVVALT